MPAAQRARRPRYVRGIGIFLLEGLKQSGRSGADLFILQRGGVEGQRAPRETSPSAYGVGFPARSLACHHIPPFPGHHLACNGIDQGKDAESLKNETLHCNTVDSCFSSKDFQAPRRAERRSAQGQRRWPLHVWLRPSGRAVLPALDIPFYRTRPAGGLGRGNILSSWSVDLEKKILLDRGQ